jgi:hypothetical protein
MPIKRKNTIDDVATTVIKHNETINTTPDEFESGLSADEILLYRVVKYIGDGTLDVKSDCAAKKIRPLVEDIERRLGL